MWIKNFRCAIRICYYLNIEQISPCIIPIFKSIIFWFPITIPTTSGCIFTIEPIISSNWWWRHTCIGMVVFLNSYNTPCIHLPESCLTRIGTVTHKVCPFSLRSIIFSPTHPDKLICFIWLNWFITPSKTCRYNISPTSPVVICWLLRNIRYITTWSICCCCLEYIFKSITILSLEIRPYPSVVSTICTYTIWIFNWLELFSTFSVCQETNPFCWWNIFITNKYLLCWILWIIICKSYQDFVDWTSRTLDVTDILPWISIPQN